MSNEVGFNSETAVLDYLVSKGYSLLVRNYSIHNVGELDLVMMKDNDVYIVEVKSRLAKNISNWGSPELAINNSKLLKIRKTSKYLINQYRLFDSNIIILAASVIHDIDGNVLDIDVFEI